ncbi:MAG: PAS domain-containing protein [Gammaproteobacteria bacterium]|nr:PAS domain-containing protein [Gammaproteobacteria bacterium]
MVESIQHTLEQFDPGIIWLDQNNVITAMNAVASDTFEDGKADLIGQQVLDIHPEKSREKIKCLFDQLSNTTNPLPPMTVMLNNPERVLLIKLSAMAGPSGTVGACLVFFDITGLTHVSEPVGIGLGKTHESLQLLKLPVYKNNQVLLVELDNVVCIKAEGHYSTLFTEYDSFLCNLNLTDIENRLELPYFVRVHRSYIVNMQYAMSFEKIDNQCYLVLDHNDGLRVPVSRSNVSKLKVLLGLA